MSYTWSSTHCVPIVAPLLDSVITRIDKWYLGIDISYLGHRMCCETIPCARMDTALPDTTRLKVQREEEREEWCRPFEVPNPLCRCSSSHWRAIGYNGLARFTHFARNGSHCLVSTACKIANWPKMALNEVKAIPLPFNLAKHGWYFRAKWPRVIRSHKPIVLSLGNK